MINQLINLRFLSAVQTAVLRGDTGGRAPPSTSPVPTAGTPLTPGRGVQSPMGDSCSAKCPESTAKPLEWGHCCPCPLKMGTVVAVPCHGAGGQEEAPRWGVVAPVSPLGKWTGGTRAVLVPSALIVQARSHFACAWRGHSRKELPKVGELFVSGFWWHSHLHFAGSKDAGKLCEVQAEISSFRNARLAEWAADKIPALCSGTEQLYKAPELLLKFTEGGELDHVS